MPDNNLARRWKPDEVIPDGGAQTHDLRSRPMQIVGFAARALPAPEVHANGDL